MKKSCVKTGVFIAGCIVFVMSVMILGDRKKSHISKFTGWVKETREYDLLISQDQGVGILSISYSQLSGNPGLQAGDRIKVEYEGEILESSPGRINDKNGVKITKINNLE